MSKKKAPLVFNAPHTVTPRPEAKKTAEVLEVGQGATKKESKQPLETAEPKKETVYIGAQISEEARKQLRILAVQEGKTSQDLILEAINDLFMKHKLNRIA